MIQWNKGTLENESSIATILGLAQSEWNKRRQLYERFRRKTSYSELVSETDEKIKVALEYYITNMTTGYFAGKAPIYSVNKTVDEKQINIIKKLFNKIFGTSNDPDELKSLIDYVTKYNDDATEFYDLAFDYFCVSACYETLYENKNNEIVYTKTSALNTIAIYDFSTPVNQIGQLRSWIEKDSNNLDITIVELTTINGKKFYNNKLDKDKYIEDTELSKPQKWDDLPCIAIENRDGLSCFELVISLITAYERVNQNSRNTFQYNDDAKLMIRGYSPENEMTVTITDEKTGELKTIINPAREKEDEYTLKTRTFYVNEDGEVKWIEKNVQDSALQNHKKTLIDLIAMITGVPNITDLGFTNADNASALDRKFFALEQNITDADKQFKKQLLRRWELIVGKINKKKNTKFDFRDINITLKRNLPTDKKTETDRALSLKGTLSEETVISMLPDDLDVKAELKKIEDQDTVKLNNIMSNTSNKMPNLAKGGIVNTDKGKELADPLDEGAVIPPKTIKESINNE